MATYIYVRVSTLEQAANGASLPQQVRTLVAYCEQQGWDLGVGGTIPGVPGVFADPGISAWKTSVFVRPGFLSMWERVKPGDRIVCLQMDRMFRSTLDFLRSYEHFVDAEVELRFMHNDMNMSTATGRLTATMFAAMAQFKSDILSERHREATRSKVLQKPGRRKLAANARVKGMVTRVKSPANSVLVNPDASAGRIFQYMRVSTTGQSVDSQRRVVGNLTRAREAKGYVALPPFEETGVSAYSVNFAARPVAKQILESVRPGDVIVAARLDRMFRSFVDMANTMKMLKDKGVDLAIGDQIDTSTLGGQMMAALSGVLAEHESAENSRRVKDVQRHLLEVRGFIKLPRSRIYRAEQVSDVEYILRVKPLELQELFLMLQWQDEARTHAEGSIQFERFMSAKLGRPELPKWPLESAQWAKKLHRDYGKDAFKQYRRWAQRNRISRYDTVCSPYSHRIARRCRLRFRANDDYGKWLIENNIDLDAVIRRANRMRPLGQDIYWRPAWWPEQKAKLEATGTGVASAIVPPQFRWGEPTALDYNPDRATSCEASAEQNTQASH